MLKRRSAIGGAAALLAASARGALAAEPVQVGCTVPLTGALNASGQQYHYSLQMAQDDINAKGGLAGRPLEIVFADTRDSNAVAVNAFLDLSRRLPDAPLVFLSSYTTQNLATEPSIKRAEITALYAGGGDSVADRDDKWLFRIRPADGLQGLVIAQFLQDELKSRKPGIIYIQNDFGQGVADTVAKEVVKAGATVAAKETYGANDKDMSAQLERCRSNGADALVVVGYGADGALIIKAAKQLGMTLPIVASSGIMIPSILALFAPDEVAHLYGTIDAFLDEDANDAAGDYAKRFHKRFGVKADPYGSCYYDGAMMLKAAVDAAGFDRAKIRDWFAAVKDWKGVTRVYSTDAKNNMAHSLSIVKFAPGTTNLSFVKTVTASAA